MPDEEPAAAGPPHEVGDGVDGRPPEAEPPALLRQRDVLDLDVAGSLGDQQDGADELALEDDPVQVAPVQVLAQHRLGLVGLEQERHEGLAVVGRLQRHTH